MDSFDSMPTIPSISDTDFDVLENVPEMFQCGICDFISTKEIGVKIHEGVKHKERKRTSEKYVAKKEKEENCFKLFDVKTSKIVGFIHDSSCWSFYSPCINLPEPAADDEEPTIDGSGQLHLLDTLVLEGSVMNWDHVDRVITDYKA